METEVTTTTNEKSIILNSTISNIQPIQKEFNHTDENVTANFSGEHISTESTTGEGYTPGDSQYLFEDDEVFRIDNKGRVKFGLVLKTPDPYLSDNEDDEFHKILEKGKVRVAWYAELDSIEKENAIGLADRTLNPGDIVIRLLGGKETQKGYCRDVNMKADVKVLGTKYAIKNVNAERLRLISNWQRDDAVCLDSWVGITRDVEEKVILRTACGCRIEISLNYIYNFRDLNSSRQGNIFNPEVFYPGNTIIGNLPPMAHIKILTPDIPLLMNKNGNAMSRKFTIESVYTYCVWVNWQWKAYSDEANLENLTLKPSPCVSGEDLKRLKRLDFLGSCMLQIVDRCYLRYSNCDTLVKKSDWDKEQAIKFKEIFKKQKEEKQKMFVHSSITGTTGTAGSHHHYEKLTKKLSLTLDDTTGNKLKGNIFKEHKSGKREASQDVFKQEKVTPKSNNNYEAEWLSTEDDTEVGEDNCDIIAMDIYNIVENLIQDCICTTTTMSTCSSPSSHKTPSYLIKRQLKKKAGKNLKKPFSAKHCAEFKPKEGDELVIDALLVYSTATVVWQDGTIEHNIPSTQLYPIDPLNDYEFFPGDFVISAKEDQDFSHRDYGVMQTVDHEGRTANVKWFTTYTSADEPTPTCKGETECSLYDLKEHADFQYHPGRMVIRVSNFVGEDTKCTAGQVIDKYIDGRVKVWWIDGHISLCYPQDLLEVAQLDQDDFSQASEDSWETKSENGVVSSVGESSLKLSASQTYMLSNIKKASSDLHRLQQIFHINPNLQDSEVMRKLLKVYKSCRFLDRLLNTNFFHEDHFSGLIVCVQKADAIAMNVPVQDQKNPLFNDNLQTNSPNTNNTHQLHQYSDFVVSLACAGHTNTSKRRNSSPLKESQTKKSDDMHIVDFDFSSQSANPSANGTANMSDNKTKPQKEISPNLNKEYNTKKNKLLNSVMMNIEKANEKIAFLTSASQDDLDSNFVQNENYVISAINCFSSAELEMNINTNSNKKSDDQSNAIKELPVLICVRLCSLLKNQLNECLHEIEDDDQPCLGDVGKVDLLSEEGKSTETIIDIENNKVKEKSQADQSVAITTAKPELPPLSKLSTDMSTTTENATEESDLDNLSVNKGIFEVVSTAPKNHKYQLTIFHPNSTQQYYKAVQREYRLLKTSLPPGVYVKAYEDRMDLLSVMIEGPRCTPYEGGLFFFDIQLGRDYPKNPPFCHYISYCSDRLNPNLYENGKVCVSLLGTWIGKKTEVWGPNSTLLQVLVSIQGLILVPEPYFNEPGYEKQMGTQQGKENSRVYNEMAILKLVQSTTKLLQNPPQIFLEEIKCHLKNNGLTMIERIEGWLELSKQIYSNSEETSTSLATQYTSPDFPLIPVSRGFWLSLVGLLKTFKQRIVGWK